MMRAENTVAAMGSAQPTRLGAHGSDAVDAPQEGGEGDGGAQHDGDCHGEDDVGRPCDRVTPDSPDEADPGSSDDQAVADDEFGTVCGDEAGG